MDRSGNPVLTANTFGQLGGQLGAATAAEAMTIQGTVNKTFLLLLILLAPALYTWQKFYAGDADAVAGLLVLGIVGGLIAALICVFKKSWAPVLAPLYAVFEGLVLGGISAQFEQKFPGIVIQSVGLTFGVLLALLLAYTSRLIKVTQNFRLGIVAATGGIALFYLVTMVLSFFGIQIPYIHESGWVGIGFSLFVVMIAALNLVLDFDFIESGAAAGAPKYMEWYGAFGLLVTLVWLYLEILRLLAKTRSRR